MDTLVAVAPCDKCGRELMTDEQFRGWYWQAGCADIHGDGCDGHADETKLRVETIVIY